MPQLGSSIIASLAVSAVVVPGSIRLFVGLLGVLVPISVLCWGGLLPLLL